MLTICSDSEGAIVGLRQEDDRPNPPETAATLAIDEATNGALVTELYRSTDAFHVAGGTLYREGQAVAINPPSLATTEREQALTLAKGLKQYNALTGNPTTAQTVAAVKANNRLTLILGRILLREMEGE